MDFKIYLEKFQKAADKLDRKLLAEKQIEVAVGEVLDSVFLKLYKKSWSNPSQEPLTARSRIFFSIWMNDSAIEGQRIFYNIHAFKLRHLKSYLIQSRKFADRFRNSFKEYEHNWQNVSVNFGPLTLMEGWQKLDLENFQSDVSELANSFLEIEHLVADTIESFRP